VRFLQDIVCPDGALLARVLINVEQHVYCVTREEADHYRRVVLWMAVSLQDHRMPVSPKQLRDDIKPRVHREAMPYRAGFVNRVLEVSPSTMKLGNGTIASSVWKEFQGRSYTNMAAVTLRMLGRPANCGEILKTAQMLLGRERVLNKKLLQNTSAMMRKTFVRVERSTCGLENWA
jgi:hypothetical protein